MSLSLLVLLLRVATALLSPFRGIVSIPPELPSWSKGGGIACADAICDADPGGGYDGGMPWWWKTCAGRRSVADEGWWAFSVADGRCDEEAPFGYSELWLAPIEKEEEEEKKGKVILAYAFFNSTWQSKEMRKRKREMSGRRKVKDIICTHKQ